MKNVNSNPSIQKYYSHRPIKSASHTYLEELKSYNATLDHLNKSLENLLKDKRMEFGRFFFLSNDELLSILSEASRDPRCVIPHLRKLFENIATIDLREDMIRKVYSAEGEELRYFKVKTNNQPVEKWLS